MLFQHILFIAAMTASVCSHAETHHTKVSSTTVTNFSNFHSGQEYCADQVSKDPKIQSCMPIYNENNNAFLNIESKVIGSPQPVAPGTVFTVNDHHETDSINFVVTNAVANKVIFSGPVYDMLGIICDYNSCKPWK
ncbi:hypothetical protein [Parashewanella tropica]|uniref:hypothetical protein n=1 Tax=Parashewanella tropica TaxID=2547970 RepID=UPI00105A9EA0|nr:hypothetical protein [Parashewanella tropica]